MKSIGEDSPSKDDIDYYGLYHSCQQTRGNFALYKLGEYAARGRVGTSPLYWDRKTLTFSFVPQSGLEDFPPGYLFNVKQNRLVCWDSMYFDKPLETRPDALARIEKLIESAIRFLQPKTDAFLLSAGCGSRVINQYIDDDKPAYTVAYKSGDSVPFDIANVTNENRTVLYFDDSTKYPSSLDEDEVPMYVLARFLKNTTSHRKFICGLGCTQLFSDTENFFPYVKHVVDQFAKFGLEVYSPFFDNRLMEYVLDMTSPCDREMILDILLNGSDLDYGHDIHETVGFSDDRRRKNKKWWYW